MNRDLTQPLMHGLESTITSVPGEDKKELFDSSAESSSGCQKNMLLLKNSSLIHGFTREILLQTTRYQAA